VSRVLVIGGGLAGLAAAYELQQQGVRPVLIEASSRLGGKVATAHLDGLLLEEGPDSFVTIRPAALELCRELRIDGELIEPRADRSVAIWSRGALSPLPDGIGLGGPTRLRPFLSTQLLSPGEKLRAALDLVLPRHRDDGDMAVGALLRRRFGDAIVDRLLGPLIEAVYRCPVDALSARAAMPQLVDLERRHRSLLLGTRVPPRATKQHGPPIVALRNGMQRLVERLTAALDETEIHLRTRVCTLRRGGGGYQARLVDGSLLDADCVLLATPAAAAGDILMPMFPDAAQLLHQFPNASTAVVNLAFPRQAVPARLDHGFLVAAGESVRIRAGTWSSEKWEGRSPDGIALLRVFLDPDRATDASLIDTVRHDLKTMFGIRADPIVAQLRRLPASMPLYSMGHLERVTALEQAVAGEGGRIGLAGAFYRGSGVADCIQQGRAAARTVAAAAALQPHTP
jgi:oxygen-dependent protoporphyrinogen oxidase